MPKAESKSHVCMRLFAHPTAYSHHRHSLAFTLYHHRLANACCSFASAPSRPPALSLWPSCSPTVAPALSLSYVSSALPFALSPPASRLLPPASHLPPPASCLCTYAHLL